ncbi:transcription factor E2-alpha-like [Nycticebus coucang]|uniref:transcription factor E2-alpha-like n=1 Tax=Nycticebus coucang TaxID=9470 RepID=UPI00234D604F|nr:transcription factor E2-alpha-like [Nycticebus coucang]
MAVSPVTGRARVSRADGLGLPAACCTTSGCSPGPALPDLSRPPHPDCGLLRSRPGRPGIGEMEQEEKEDQESLSGADNSEDEKDLQAPRPLPARQGYSLKHVQMK